MTIDITIYCEEEVMRRSVLISDARAFVNLVKTFGYLDDDGNEYKFKSAQLENSGMDLCIYVESV